MSDPTEVAADALRNYPYDPETKFPPLSERLALAFAVYERAKVVCDECDGFGVFDCQKPGPFLKDSETGKPFHADTNKVNWFCVIDEQLRGHDPCSHDDSPRWGCGWVRRFHKIWEEA